MTPVAFDGCFGWLHAGHGDRGVVLCSPLGHEAVATHRGWRQLAELLSGQGLHVIRFDYHGTGDSEGDCGDPSRLHAWQRNVEAAALLLRQRCQVASVTLVGLRFGAALAMLAASGSEAIDAVALLAPVVSGRTYLRELRLLARVWHEQAFGKTPPKDDTGGLEVTGTRHSPSTVQAIGGVDLRQLRASIPRTLIMDTGDRIEAKQLADRLAANGSVVTRLPFIGESDFLTEPVTARIPCDAFVHLAAWIGSVSPTERPPAAAGGADAVIHFAGGRETLIRFGTNAGLTGVLCRPTCPAPGARLVVMVNTGRTPHTGDGRFYVTLSRALARCGTASLRMDIAGLGDSDCDPRVGRTVLHDMGSCADVSAAMDHVAALGWTWIALVGVCSGAFLAFQTALRDGRVRSVDLINQQRFLAEVERPVSAAAGPLRRPASFYLKSLARAVAWRAVLTGRVNPVQVGLGVLRPILDRYARSIARRYEMLTGRVSRGGSLHRSFRALEDRQVDVRLWYGDTDQGWPELESWFGRRGQGVQRFRNVELETLVGADHALHWAKPRERLTTLICQRLGARRPGVDHDPDPDVARVEIETRKMPLALTSV